MITGRRRTAPKTGWFPARLIVAVLCGSLIVRCSAGETGTLPTKYGMIRDAQNAVQRPSFVPTVIIDSGNDKILLLDSTFKKVQGIDAPTGFLAMDMAGNIYDASYQGDNVLRIYERPYGSSPTKISFNDVGVISGLAVDNKNGVFSVTALPQNPGSNGAILFFRRGRTTPCASVRLPTAEYISQAAFDASGTLYFFEALGRGFVLASLAGQCMPKSIITYNPTLSSVATLQFNSKNELAIDEGTIYKAMIVTYAHPSGRELGKVLYETFPKGIDGRAPIMYSLASNAHQLWASRVFGEGLGLYNYPGGGAPARLLNFYNVGGVAVYPPIIP